MRSWSKPTLKGIPPSPRDSHSCTTVGDKLFVFGGTDGKNPLKDTHILDTCEYINLYMWVSHDFLCFFVGAIFSENAIEILDIQLQSYAVHLSLTDFSTYSTEKDAA